MAMIEKKGVKLQPMARYSPENHRERGNAYRDEDRDPDGTTKQELLNIWLPDCECAEWRGFRTVEEDEHWVELVLMGNKKEEGKCKGNEQEESLRFRLHIQENKCEGRRERNPETNEARYKAHKRGHGRKVTKSLRSEETREGILLHGTEAVFLLRMEHIRNLGECTSFIGHE